MADMVVVTELEYVTIYPSPDIPTAAVSQIIPQPTSGAPESKPIMTTTPHPSMSIPKGSMTAHYSTTGIPSLPSGWPEPKTSSEHKLWNDSLAKLSLAAVVLMAVVLLSLVGYAIYQRFRGKCHKCTINEDKLRKWDSGELKRITKDMVKARETIASSKSRPRAAPAACDIDLEAGVAGNHDAERDAARAEALATLNRPASVVQKASLFERAKGALKKKEKQPSLTSMSLEPVLPSQEPNPRPSTDRLFAVVEPVTLPSTVYKPAQHPSAKQYESNDVLDRAYDPPSLGHLASPSSVYSYDSGIAPNIRPKSRQSEQYQPSQPLRSQSPVEGSVVSTALHIYDYRHRARYDEAQRVMELGTAPEAVLQKAVKDVNTIEAQMQTKRRSQAYGGLPDPEEFDLGGEGSKR